MTTCTFCSQFKPLSRDWAAWASCLSPLSKERETMLTSASQHLLHQRATEADSHVVDPPSPMTVNDDLIEEHEPCTEEQSSVTYGANWTTQFLLRHAQHRREPVPHSREDAYVWTEKQRTLAMHANRPSTVGELQNEVRPLAVPWDPFSRLLMSSATSS